MEGQQADTLSHQPTGSTAGFSSLNLPHSAFFFFLNVIQKHIRLRRAAPCLQGGWRGRHRIQGPEMDFYMCKEF